MESAKRQKDQCKRYEQFMQRSISKTYTALQVIFAESCKNQKHGGNEERVGTGDEKEEVDDNSM